MGKGDKRASMASLYFPTDIVVGHTGMFVSDTGNNRVLYWKEVPTENGQPADLVFGQTNFSDQYPNRHAQANASTLNDPYGLWLEEEENPEWVEPDEVEEEESTEEASAEEATEENNDNDKEEIPEYLFKLFIADRGNSRVVVWNELPVMATDEEEVEDDEIEIEDPNLLIGEDVDEDYVEEEEDSTPEELPSA